MKTLNFCKNRFLARTHNKVLLLVVVVLIFLYTWMDGSTADVRVPPKKNPAKGGKDVVAFVISLTGLKKERWEKNNPDKPFPTGPPSMNYFDGAAVLAKSIEKNFDFPYALVAIIHESVKADFTYLKKLGYRVLIVPTPVKLSEINSTVLRGEIVGSGCCGELELIKYEAYKLTEYSKIVLLDSDVILTKPHALTSLVNKLDSGTKLIFNFDRSMASTKAKDDCVSAGFLVFKPSIAEYHFFIDLVKSGQWDGNGWVNSHMGYCYGGPTVQGLMAYYRYLHPKDCFESDNCRVNTISTNVNSDGEDCSKVNPLSIEMFHFSICPKPWDCGPEHTAICKYVTKMWWDFRNLVEADFGLPIKTKEDACKDGRYIDITRNISISQLKHIADRI